jgi:hypothetical protein
MRAREAKAIRLLTVTKSQVPMVMLQAAAQTIENYANENISESLDAFGQFMYHAQLLRNNHLDTYLLDLHLVEQPYRDILVLVFSELAPEDVVDYENVDDEDSTLDTEA